MSKNRATSSGGIVIRAFDDVLKIALAREEDKGPNAWVIPKGHAEDGEGNLAAAIREIGEEVGLFDVQPIAYLGAIERESLEDWGEEVLKTIHLYLVYSFSDGPSVSSETAPQVVMRWFTLAEALDAIPFEEDCGFLRDKLKPMLAGDL